MILITIFVVFFIVGMVLGLVKLILGDTIFNSILAMVGIYAAYKFFSFFGAFAGILILIGVVVIILMGMVDIAKDVGSAVTGFGRK